MTSPAFISISFGNPFFCLVTLTVSTIHGETAITPPLGSFFHSGRANWVPSSTNLSSTPYMSWSPIRMESRCTPGARKAPRIAIIPPRGTSTVSAGETAATVSSCAERETQLSNKTMYISALRIYYLFLNKDINPFT